MNQSELATHEVSVGDLLVQTFVIELDNPIYCVAEHRLEFGDLFWIVIAATQR